MPKSPSDQRDGATYLGLVGLAYAAGLDRVRRVVGTGLAAERVDRIGSEGAAAPVCPQNRAYGSVHGSSRKAYPLTHIKPVR
jgi:hypothetical protein